MSGFLAGTASANSLTIDWNQTFVTHLPGSVDLVVDGGGTEPNGVLLTSGTDVAADSYVSSYLVPLTNSSYPGITFTSLYTGLAGGTVGYGYISGFVAATLVTNFGSGDAASARFFGTWTDMVTMTPMNPALIGQTGTASSSFLVHVEAGDTAIGEATRQFETANQLGFTFAVFAETDATYSAQYGITCDVTADEPGSCSDGTDVLNNPTTQTVSVPFVYNFIWGTPFALTGEVTASSFSGAQSGTFVPSDPTTINYTADGSANFLNTVLWEGISEVRDADGNLVEFTVSSDSGTDWAQPATAVPAPPALWLFATGLAGLFARRLRAARN